MYHVIHADAYIDGINLCQNLGKGNIEEENSFFKKTGILFPLIALERKMTYILQQTKEDTADNSKVIAKVKINVFNFD